MNIIVVAAIAFVAGGLLWAPLGAWLHYKFGSTVAAFEKKIGSVLGTGAAPGAKS